MTQLRYEPRHFHQHRFPRLRTANAAATLSVLGVVAAVLPWVGWPKQVTVGVLVLTILIGLGLVTAPPTRALKRGGIAPGARWHWGAAMLLGMSPAILLGLSFPVVSQKMAASTVSGIGLPVIVLSVSVAVPWLSQIIGTPVYRLLGDSIGRGPRAVLERYCSIWPALFLWALLPTALEILVVAAVTGWNLHVLGVHTALLLLHVVFVQSLIVADVAGRRRLWSVGWLCYAVALVAEPTWWYLPPLVGALSQLLSMGRSLGRILRPRGVATGILVQDMLRGAILGGVLWSDKFFLFLGAGRDFDVALVYLCLQPAVVAYCYYFAVTAPRVNTEIALFQTVLKREGMASLRERGRTLRRLLDASLIRACIVGVAGVIVVVCSMALMSTEQVPLVLEVCLASTLFTVLTLLSYEIDHIGDSTTALLLSGIHVAIAAALLLKVAPPPTCRWPASTCCCARWGCCSTASGGPHPSTRSSGERPCPGELVILLPRPPGEPSAAILGSRRRLRPDAQSRRRPRHRRPGRGGRPQDQGRPRRIRRRGHHRRRPERALGRHPLRRLARRPFD